MPDHGLLRRLPKWDEKLYTDADVSNFVYLGGKVDHPLFNRLAAQATPDHAPKLLRDLVDQSHIDLTDQAMCGAVAETWACGEPGSPSCIGTPLWLMLFRANGYSYLYEHADLPTEPVSVYRGSPHDHRFGMSWTTRLDVAHRFAFDRIPGRPRGAIHQALIEPRYLLAYIEDGHSEYEWVVDPSGLSDANVSTHTIS